MTPFWYAACLTFGPATVGYVGLTVTAGALLGAIPLQLHVDTRRAWATETDGWHSVEVLPAPRQDLAGGWPQRLTRMDLPSIWDPEGRTHLRAAETPIVIELHIGGGRHRLGEAPGTDAQRASWNSDTYQFWALIEFNAALDEPCSHCSAPEDGEPPHAGCPGCCCPCGSVPALPEGVEGYAIAGRRTR